jgi:hypothetical protein
MAPSGYDVLHFKGQRVTTTAEPPNGGCYDIGLKHARKAGDRLMTLELDGET